VRSAERGSGHDESRNEIFERRRTDVGRCFYERQAVCVDVNYIGGHGEQIAASSDAHGLQHTYVRGLLLNGLGLGRRRGYRVSLCFSVSFSCRDFQSR